MYSIFIACTCAAGHGTISLHRVTSTEHSQLSDETESELTVHTLYSGFAAPLHLTLIVDEVLNQVSIDDVLICTWIIVHIVLRCRSCSKWHVTPEVTHQEIPVGTKADSLTMKLLHVSITVLVSIASLNTFNTLVCEINGFLGVVPAVLDITEV